MGACPHFQPPAPPSPPSPPPRGRIPALARFLAFSLSASRCLFSFFEHCRSWPLSLLISPLPTSRGAFEGRHAPVRSEGEESVQDLVVPGPRARRRIAAAAESRTEPVAETNAQTNEEGNERTKRATEPTQSRRYLPTGRRHTHTHTQHNTRTYPLSFFFLPLRNSASGPTVPCERTRRSGLWNRPLPNVPTTRYRDSIVSPFRSLSLFIILLLSKRPRHTWQTNQSVTSTEVAD